MIFPLRVFGKLAAKRTASPGSTLARQSVDPRAESRQTVAPPQRRTAVDFAQFIKD
jgi:hypothetical protein